MSHLYFVFSFSLEREITAQFLKYFDLKIPDFYLKIFFLFENGMLSQKSATITTTKILDI